MTKKNKRKIIEYSMFAFIIFGIFIFPAIILWKSGFGELGLRFWQIQLGWITICGGCMFVLGGKSKEAQ